MISTHVLRHPVLVRFLATLILANCRGGSFLLSGSSVAVSKVGSASSGIALVGFAFSMAKEQAPQKGTFHSQPKGVLTTTSEEQIFRMDKGQALRGEKGSRSGL
jgi:hypothetical protein